MAIESLSACDDRVDARGWETVGSAIVDMELPPGFTGSGQTSQVARWNGPAGWIRAASHSGDAHTGWTGTITSECDVYISGSPAHIDLVSGYGRAVHALVKVSGAPDLALEAQARTIGGQAQLLHAIRYARISAAWGHPY